LTQVTNGVNGAYTRWEYGGDWRDIYTYSTIQEGAGEAWTITSRDGAGRTWATIAGLPNSTGGYRIQWQAYDNMGRMIHQTNPTETNASWVGVAEDAAGWVYSYQSYDWKGRRTVTTNQDGTTKTASYGGCGCAGGEVVTLTDEVGRKQKIYSDVLGRTAKAEAYNWNGTTVYSATVNTYNARDQVMQTRQYAGTEGSGTYQDTTMGYDGYGRLNSKHVPEQNAGTATTYSYNTDDTVQSVTDARGATCTYGYNARHQVNTATHTLSGQNTIAVSYAYDGAGNRTAMSDSSGSTSYAYDQLSRMTSETRTFSGLGSYSLSYDYNLAGELKKITDPTNVTINNNYDSIGRMTGITGENNLFGGVSQYASGLTYRAWGGIKGMTYGSNYTLAVNYNARLQQSQFEVAGSPPQSAPQP